MKFILINSNNESSFAASYIDNNIHVKYTSDFLNTQDKTSFLKSPDHLIHCLKFITEKVQSEGYQLTDFDAIGVITGPGSFTGIRVGLALAKGIAGSLGKKIIPVDNFELILKQSGRTSREKNCCVLIPAKLPELYYKLYRENNEIETGCILVDDFPSKFDKNTTLVGNFSDDYEKNLGYFEILNIKNLKPELDSMIELIIEKYNAVKLYEPEIIEPVYMKDFAFRRNI